MYFGKEDGRTVEVARLAPTIIVFLAWGRIEENIQCLCPNTKSNVVNINIEHCYSTVYFDSGDYSKVTSNVLLLDVKWTSWLLSIKKATIVFHFPFPPLDTTSKPCFHPSTRTHMSHQSTPTCAQLQ
jgi:hypothetical protein